MSGKSLRKKLLALLLIMAAMLTLFLPVFAQTGGVRYQGIDVSQYQKQIDWNKVKSAGIQYAMIRTGYGGDVDDWDVQTDPYFASNYAGATGAGIKVGVYHYSYATNVAMAQDEANFCLHILNGRRLDYPIAYDVEDSKQACVSPDTMAQIVQTFCGIVQQAGYRVAVYSDISFYNSKLTSPSVRQYDTWIANFTSDPAPHFSGNYTMWQYTSTGSVPGISGACDMDYSYVDYSGNGGNSSSSSDVSMDPMTFQCDTSSYTFETSNRYIYKIATADTYPPTAVSSNPSAVTVSSGSPTAGGYLFTITNVGAGTATITTTAGDGRSVAFQAVGNGSGSLPVDLSGGTLRCDTTQPYTFGSNGTYSYKIISSAAGIPMAVSSNSSAVPVSFVKKLSDGYLFQIKNAGKGTATITTADSSGRSVAFQATGTAIGGVVSDTPYYFTMKKGGTYQFRFTNITGGSCTFSSANSSVARPVSNIKSGYDTYYKITASGKGCTGVYVIRNGLPCRVCVVTVT